MKCTLITLAVGVNAVQAAQTVLGAYVLSRHGDRTDKSHPPTKLTNLGYQQVLSSGDDFRRQYIESTGVYQIMGISQEAVVQTQIYISTTDDAVLMNSAQAFLQGLYPPIGTLANETLRNGTVFANVNGGYQLIPIHTLDTSAAGKEDEVWLQSTSGCDNAVKSSKAYTQSPQYKDLLKNTADFYKTLAPVWANTFTADQSNFSNAYTLYDVVNVAMIHNDTIKSSNLLTDENLAQLRTLADQQQFNLAYNASDPARSIQGATFAAEALSHLQQIIDSKGKTKLGIQFNAYATFLSFFGLAQLPAADPTFYGIPDYASSMTFELVTNSTATVFPDIKDIDVRFKFHNGSSLKISNGGYYPLFGQGSVTLPWTEFATQMQKIAVSTQDQWCDVCGNTDGACAAAGASSSSGGNGQTGAAQTCGKKGMSNVVAGVIGAVVTLAVVLLAEGIILAIAGLTIASKKKLRGNNSGLEKQASISS